MAIRGTEFADRLVGYASNFPSFYEASWPLVDALVFLLIFVGLARAVFEKRFPGQGGKALMIGVGVALTIGMVWAEIEYGISLRSFGPYAAGIILLLLSMMLFHVGRAMGLGVGGSVALVVFLGIPLAPQLLPGLGPLIGQLLPLVLLFWLASGAMSGRSLWEHSRLQTWMPHRLNPLAGSVQPSEAHQLKVSDRAEKHEVKDAVRQSRRVIKLLRRIRDSLQRGGLSPSAIEETSARLQELMKADHQLIYDLDRLQRTLGEIGQVDQEILRRTQVQLRNAGVLNVESGGGKPILQRLSFESALNSLQVEAKKYNDAFLQSIRQAVPAIQSRRWQEALRWIDHALHWERKAEKILEDIQHVHRRAHGLLRKELRGNVR